MRPGADYLTSDRRGLTSDACVEAQALASCRCAAVRSLREGLFVGGVIVHGEEVGDDRSRTWVITSTAAGLRLKHDHRHRDGSSDALTMYGGDSRGQGTAVRQEFPADAASIALFTAQGRGVSNTNVWAVEVGDAVFAYELRRPPGPAERFFRVEFDLSRPVAAPPAPWGG